MKSTKLKVFAIVFSVVATSQVEAGMRCTNGKLINKGDTTSEVIFKCEEAFNKEYIGETVVNGNFVNLDRWTHVPPKGGLVKILDFHNGKLMHIKNGPRVK